MNQFKKILIVTFVAIAVCTTAIATNIRSMYITNADGLSNSSVTCIYQDSHHFVWLGTWDGLNVFNGRDIQTYKYDPSNENSLSNNIIREIIEQRPNIMWIATDNGINRIDTENERIQRFHFGYDSAHSLTEHAFKLACTTDGTLFCAVDQYGLAYYEESEERFINLGLSRINLFETEGLYAFGNQLWLLDGVGRLYAITVNRDSNGKISLSQASQISDTVLYKAIFDGGGKHIPVLDTHNRLSLLDPSTGRCDECIPLPTNTPSRGELTAIVESDTILIASFSIGGAYYRTPSEKRFIPMEQLHGKAILALRSCSQQTLWAGTDGQGVIVQYPSHRYFGVILNSDIQERRSSPVRCFCTDRKGYLWVGTKGGGIFRFDGSHRLVPAQNRLTTAQGLSNNSVYCIIPGLGNDLLVGTDGQGIDICTEHAGRISPLDISLLLRNNDGFKSVYSLYLDTQKQILWAGTSGYGLIRMHLETSPTGYRVIEYKKFLYDPDDEGSISNNTIYSILPDQDGLWIGTRGGGLNRLNLQTERFTHFFHDTSNARSLSSNDVLSLNRDAAGHLWIGTSYGLNRMEQDNTFTRFTEKEGLPNNTIHGILSDARGILWISTNRGISRYTPGNTQPINYTTNDDLQNNEFSDGAYYSAPNGTFYFGGISGFNHFIPEQIHERNFSPTIGITDFKVFNNPLPPYNSAYFYHSQQGVRLNHDQHFFSIGFVALDLIDNSNCEYAYQLEGFDRDWVMASTGNTAVFTNVPPGRYIFRVRSTNSDKIWCDNELSFPVWIRHPWWARWWAFLLYAALATLIGYLIWRLVNNHLHLNKTIFLERLSQQRQQEIHEAKLRFFTNIAHEFCTPLTLIYSPCEKLLESGILNEESTKYIRIIRSNAQRMQGLISELMDFRKAETGHRVLRFEPIDLHELVHCIADNFAELNNENLINFSSSITPEHLTIVNDRDCLEKIVFNLISNAYKYTPIGGSIAVHINQDSTGKTTLSVTNTGKGIRPEELQTIFDRFKILDNFERQASRGSVTRTGIGLALTKSLVSLLNGSIRVESEINRQTVFTVQLPPVETPEPISEEIAPDSPEKESVPHTTGTPQVRHTLLIVDDEKQIRDLIEDLFSAHYTVLQAADGFAAIEVMKQQRPDLIISDILMPSMNGAELVKELKSNPFTASIPIIFLTSKVTTTDHISGYELGVDAYLPKPFHPQHLQAVVNRLIASRQSLRDYYNSPLAQSDLYNGAYIQKKDKDFLMQLNQIIEENLENEALSLPHIAELLTISRMQLYRRIRELTNLSPSEYIRSVKLDRAEHLLRTTELTVQEIMYRCGFNNKSYFYREFTKKHNCSPKEFRSKITDEEPSKA